MNYIRIITCPGRLISIGWLKLMFEKTLRRQQNKEVK